MQRFQAILAGINGRSKGLTRVSLHTNVNLQTVKFNFHKQLPYTNGI